MNIMKNNNFSPSHANVNICIFSFSTFRLAFGAERSADDSIQIVKNGQTMHSSMRILSPSLSASFPFHI